MRTSLSKVMQLHDGRLVISARLWRRSRRGMIVGAGEEVVVIDPWELGLERVRVVQFQG